jgi:hypothetical protein
MNSNVKKKIVSYFHDKPLRRCERIGLVNLYPERMDGFTTLENALVEVKGHLLQR